MIDKTLLNSVGEHVLTLSGPVGDIEACLTVPSEINQQYFAVLGHPHSLQGGSMNNKVVTTMARTFRDLGIVSLRFNFRGVGGTEGQYDEGVGESEDMLSIIADLSFLFPQARCLLAGFSFGSYVTYRAACQSNCPLLISIAPPVHHYDYTEFGNDPDNWLVVQGDADEVVPYQTVMDFFKQEKPQAVVETFTESGHFFHGKLIALKQRLSEMIADKL